MKLTEIRQQLIDAIEAHDYTMVPIAKRYRATENNIPSALRHMAMFRVISKFKRIAYHLEDEKRNTEFFVAVAAEGGTDVEFVCRFTVEKDLIRELEVCVIRSRGDSGFWYKPEDMMTDQIPFMIPLDADKKADYDELEKIGRATFDHNINPEIKSNANCMLMEAGGIVYESPAYIRLLNPMFVADEAKRLIREPIPFGIHPNKPDDKDGRVLAVDVEQGLAAVAIDVKGFVSPYVVPGETSTVFAPDTLIEPHRTSLTEELLDSDNTFEEMPANSLTYTIVRYQKGELMAIHQWSLVQGPGARTPWEVI